MRLKHLAKNLGISERDLIPCGNGYLKTKRPEIPPHVCSPPGWFSRLLNGIQEYDVWYCGEPNCNIEWVWTLNPAYTDWLRSRFTINIPSPARYFMWVER